MSEDRMLAARFAELSGDLLSVPDEAVTFDRVARKAVEVIPGCSMAGVTLRRRRGGPRTVASTDQVVNQLDALQEALGRGPCLDPAFDRHNYVVVDLDGNGGYGEWSRAATELGVHASMAVRLHTDSETLGALTLHARRPGTFDRESVDIALIFATHATEALSKARMITGLQVALESRHLIGMAQGVLAVRYGISYERAFDTLHRYSNQNNVKLRTVAQLVVDLQALPGGEEPAEPDAGPDARPGQAPVVRSDS